MKRIFLLFLILILNLNCSAREVNPKKITLEESIKITLQNSLDLRSTEQDIYKSEVRISQAKTGGYPSFSGSMYYTRIDPVQEISVGDRKTPLGQNNQSQGKVTFNYNLYDGGRVTNLVDATTLLSQATFCELEITRQNVLYKAISSYYDVLKSKKLLRVAENTLTTTIEQYNISRDFYEEGLVAMADVLSANAQVANTELGLIKAQNGVELAKSALNDTMGLSLTAEYDLVDNLVYKPYTVDLDYTTELAYNNRAEGKKIMYLIGAAEKQIDVAKSDRLPTVNFNFDYILFSSSLFNASNSVNATFSASIPIFDRGLTICKIDEAEANLEQAKINLEQIKKAIALQVRQAYLNFLEAAKTVDKMKATLISAEKNYEVARLRYQEGLSPFIEVSNAQLILTKAEVDNVQALYDYYLSRASLVKTTGLLPEDGNLDDIKLINTTYREEEADRSLTGTTVELENKK